MASSAAASRSTSPMRCCSPSVTRSIGIEQLRASVAGMRYGTAAGVVALARKFFEHGGFRSFKLKGGVMPPDEEIAAITALAAEFPGMPLRLDPNGGWSLQTALHVAEELAGVVEYLEDPAATVEDMSEVHRRTGIPLATNMIVTALDEVRPAFDRDAVQIVLSDHHYWGGLFATRDLAAVCRAYGRGLSMHSNTHLGISLAAMTMWPPPSRTWITPATATIRGSART